jgi:hypothetical protein
MSDSNRAALRFIEEATWNTLPGTPTMAPIRFTGESLSASVENVVSAEIRDDRMVTDLIQVSRQNNGGFDFELSYGTFDLLLQGALFGTWADNVLKNGVVENFYSIEKAFLDIDEYFLYTGMMVNGFSLNLSTGAIATGSFDFIGSTATLAQATNTASVSAATTTRPLNCMADVATLKEGSTATVLTGIHVQELSFSIANNLRPVHKITSNVLADVGVGKMDITGTLSAYFATSRLFDKFLAGTASGLEFSITDGTSSYLLEFLNVKFETDDIPTPGQDADIIESIGWRALRNAADDSMIKITRTP